MGYRKSNSSSKRSFDQSINQANAGKKQEDKEEEKQHIEF